MEINGCEIYLMNNSICQSVGGFKAKIVVVCPNQDTMDKMELFLNENQSLHDQITEMENKRLKINKQVMTLLEGVHILRGLL